MARAQIGISDTQIGEVLGKHTAIPWFETGVYAERTPLYVDYDAWPNTVTVTQLEDGAELRDPNRFNGVGSLARTDLHPEEQKDKIHLPVIDADGGAKIGRWKPGFKAILLSATDRGTYEPYNDLRDVLGDNEIDLEVFERVRMQLEVRRGSTYPAGSYVTALVLRAKENIFRAVPSSSPGHDHLYIGRPFIEEDHRALIMGLGATGIIDREWMDLTLDGGVGGVVRTPWAKKLGSLS